ncbi:MAG: hypothetical protein O3B74_07365, partial [Proteobacteria bacterium]|nr:hypothetical protein [Pseudomonadota bacterium]
REAMKEAYGYYQSAGGAQDAAQILMDMGQLDILMENPDRARVNFISARTMYRGMQNLAQEGAAIRALGDLEALEDRLPQAQMAYAEARGLFQQAGDRIAEADALFQIGALSINQDDATATALLMQSGRLYRAVGVAEWQRRAYAMARRTR